MKVTRTLTLSVYGPQTFGIGHFCDMGKWLKFMRESKYGPADYRLGFAESLSPLNEMVEEFIHADMGKKVKITMEIESPAKEEKPDAKQV